MSTVRGRGRNLEITIDRAVSDAVDELCAQFAARPDFYRGSRAVAEFAAGEPAFEDVVALRDALATFGIALDGVGGAESLAEYAERLELAYLGAGSAREVAAIPRARASREVQLSDSARSLIADFAGARADMVRRRSVPAVAAVASASVTLPAPARPVPVG